MGFINIAKSNKSIRSIYIDKSNKSNRSIRFGNQHFKKINLDLDSMGLNF